MLFFGAMTLHISTGDVSGRLRLRDCQAARLPLASLLVRHMGVSIENVDSRKD